MLLVHGNTENTKQEKKKSDSKITPAFSDAEMREASSDLDVLIQLHDFLDSGQRQLLHAEVLLGKRPSVFSDL